MPRRDRDYDEYVPRRGAGLSPAVIIAVVVGVLLFLGGLGVGAIVLFWTVAAQEVDDEAPPVVVTDGPQKTVYTRQRFREMLLGKTMDEVIAAVGQPDHTQEVGTDPSSCTWYYNNRATDPVTGKVDVAVQVVFEHGKVTGVN
jgi:hypothetical protein